MKYKAIGFDYGGVLVGEPAGGFREEVTELLDISVDKYKSLYFEHYKEMNRGGMTWEQLWSTILNELEQSDKLPSIMKISERYFPAERETDPLILSLIESLKDKGYKTGILSNNSKENAEVMRRDFASYFDVIHVSAETGFVKPEPAAFRHFADALGVELTGLVFIDDAENSLKTARECGFQDILFTDYAHLKSSLKKLDIP